MLFRTSVVSSIEPFFVTIYLVRFINRRKLHRSAGTKIVKFMIHTCKLFWEAAMIIRNRSLYLEFHRWSIVDTTRTGMGLWLQHIGRPASDATPEGAGAETQHRALQRQVCRYCAYLIGVFCQGSGEWGGFVNARHASTLCVFLFVLLPVDTAS